jgi:CRP-like cAMP-binding protein
VQRLASYLDSVAEPVAGHGHYRARLPGTKTLAAAQLGMSKETLSRLLRSLAVRGVLQLSRREIAILDRAALSALAEKAGSS